MGRTFNQNQEESVGTNRTKLVPSSIALVAGAWTERTNMYHGGSFLKLADDNKYIKKPEAQNPEVRGF